MSLAVFFSYALQFYVLMEVLGPNVIQPRVSQRWYSLAEYAVRVAINVFTCKDCRVAMRYKFTYPSTTAHPLLPIHCSTAECSFNVGSYCTKSGLITVALAATVPWLDLFVSLFGSIKITMLSLMAPAVIDTATNWEDLGREDGLQCCLEIHFSIRCHPFVSFALSGRGVNLEVVLERILMVATPFCMHLGLISKWERVCKICKFCKLYQRTAPNS